MIDTVSTWTMEHLRGAQRLALEDEAARARLDRLIHSGAGNVGDDGCVVAVFCTECGDECRPNTTLEVCDRCRKRNWMRESRKRSKHAQLAANARWSRQEAR